MLQSVPVFLAEAFGPAKSFLCDGDFVLRLLFPLLKTTTRVLAPWSQKGFEGTRATRDKPRASRFPASLKGQSPLGCVLRPPSWPAGRSLPRATTDHGCDLLDELLLAEHVAAVGALAQALQHMRVRARLQQTAIGRLPGVIGAAGGLVVRVRPDDAITVFGRVRSVTRPGTLARCRDHAGPHRVQFDVTLTGEEIAVGFVSAERKRPSNNGPVR